MKYFKIGVLILVFAGMAAALGHAEDIKFEASIDKKTVAIGESAQLGLTFYGTQNVPAPDIGNIEGCDVRYLGPSTMMTVINGSVSTSITHMYKIQPLRMGRFQFGPFTFKYEGIHTGPTRRSLPYQRKNQERPVKRRRQPAARRT
ncbi:MAG: BatD family protein [Candidatus Omnitrophota bacterium]|jgi:hypothetical protein